MGDTMNHIIQCSHTDTVVFIFYFQQGWSLLTDLMARSKLGWSILSGIMATQVKMKPRLNQPLCQESSHYVLQRFSHSDHEELCVKIVRDICMLLVFHVSLC